MVAVFIVKEFRTQLLRRWCCPPLSGETAQVITVIKEAGRLGIGFKKRCIDRRCVATVAVDEENPPEAVARKRQDYVTNDRDQGCRSQGD